MRENQLIELIERYLAGEMTAQEREDFEALRKKDASVDAKMVEHKDFTSLIKQYNERLTLETRLNAIHEEIDIHTLKEDLMAHPSWIVQMWRHHHSKISVAASVAILAILLTLFATGDLSNKDPRFQQLKADVEGVKRQVKTQQVQLGQQQNNINNAIKKGPAVNAKFRGTGFALTGNGYIVTNFHVVNGGDSVYVQNDAGESFHTKVVYTDPDNDLAFLQITDPSFKNLGAIPYTFKKSKSDLGEDVYTLGYPANDVKLAPGALTGATGFKGDTTEYELFIPVNPGNSGGPLLDSKGNIIGIINGKQTEATGVGFAKKSNYLLKAIQNIPADSLTKSLNLNTKNTMANLSRTQQIKKLRNYVFMVKVYNQ